MKLRTQMQDFHGRMLARSSKPQPHFDFEHDAMAAHAYKQAIAEWWDRPSEADSCSDAAVTWIEQRAAEILAGWMAEDRG